MGRGTSETEAFKIGRGELTLISFDSEGQCCYITSTGPYSNEEQCTLDPSLIPKLQVLSFKEIYYEVLYPLEKIWKIEKIIHNLITLF